MSYSPQVSPEPEGKVVRAGFTVLTAASVLVVSGAASAKRAADCSDAFVAEKTSPRFYPPLVSGDGNFAGHGPAITVSAKRLIVVGGTTHGIQVKVAMKAEETQSDWTTARSTQFAYMLYTPPSGCEVDHIDAANNYVSFDSNGYLARALLANPYLLPAGNTDPVEKSFVLSYTVWDDRSGADVTTVNSYTSVQVKTRKLTVHLYSS
jgi:hypothetical protein